MTRKSATRIGVLGGGQLGLMMAEAGAALGFEFLFLDPAPDACAGAHGELLTAAYDDPQALDELAQRCDIVTWDFENVPESSAHALLRKVTVWPPAVALGACQDRLTEKRLFQQLGLGVPLSEPVASRPDLLKAIDQVGLPAVLKTRRFGYDGKGQAVLRGNEDLERAWQRLGDHELILEAFVPFAWECSIVLVRGRDGDCRTWPLTANVHEDGILAISRVPAPVPALQDRAVEMAKRVAQHFDYVGVMTLELFVTQDGRLLVNEIAPRVHNSGHWTIEGARTSQFENHLRAIAGLPLGDTAANGHAMMFNWIGSMPDDSLAELPGVHWHDYGKAARPGRKVGHATVTANSAETLHDRAARLAAAAGGRAAANLRRITAESG